MSWLIDRITREAPEARLVVVGDLIDRGPNSREVLGRAQNLGPQAIVLCGNHERMMIDFLDDPVTWGGRWQRHGGGATLRSFGITVPEGVNAYAAIRDQLRAAMPAGQEAWLRGLPLMWQSGNLVITHAGAAPRRPIDRQDPMDLLWGPAAFGRLPRRDGLWIAHGHQIVPAPRCRRGIISVDTGAYLTGRLTAALISKAGIRFLTTSP